MRGVPVKARPRLRGRQLRPHGPRSAIARRDGLCLLRANARLLSEKCKWRSEPLNPWSCGLGRFRRFAAIVGNGIPSPGITETRLKTSFSQKDGFGCVVGSKSVREAERPAGPVTPYKSG